MTTDSSDVRVYFASLFQIPTCCDTVRYASRWIAKVRPSLERLRLLIFDSWSAPRARRGPMHHEMPPPASSKGIMDKGLATAGWLTKEGRGRGNRMCRRRHLEEMCQYILLPGKRRETKGLMYGCPRRANKPNIQRTSDGIRKRRCVHRPERSGRSGW
jgi:hypothetical protein